MNIDGGLLGRKNGKQWEWEDREGNGGEYTCMKTL